MIPTCIFVATTYFIFDNVNIMDVLFILLLSALINIIRIYLLQILDLKKPKLNWDAEYILIRNNSNVLISMALYGIIILFLIYFANVFNTLSLTTAVLSIALILVIFYIIINIYIKRNERKLFSKII